MKPALEQALASAILSLPEVEERPSRFNKSRTAFYLGPKEIAHVEHGTLDLRLTRKAISARRTELKANPRIRLRGGDWIDVKIESQADVTFAIKLVEAALQANTRA